MKKLLLLKFLILVIASSAYSQPSWNTAIETIVWGESYYPLYNASGPSAGNESNGLFIDDGSAQQWFDYNRANIEFRVYDAGGNEVWQDATHMWDGGQGIDFATEYINEDGTIWNNYCTEGYYVVMTLTKEQGSTIVDTRTYNLGMHPDIVITNSINTVCAGDQASFTYDLNGKW